MRTAALSFLLVAFFFVGTASAQQGRGGPASLPTQAAALGVCASLRGATPGLLGLCQAYCKERDQSTVDMNDIASVRRAAPSVALLDRYNAIKTEDDPDMPCFADSDTATSDLPNEPPAPTSCACWTADEIGLIDGELASSRGMVPGAQCTLNDSDVGIYEAQIYEGYNVGTSTEVVVSSSFAYFDPGDASIQGCMAQSASGSFLNFTLPTRAEAQYCIQMIVDQCAAVNP